MTTISEQPDHDASALVSGPVAPTVRADQLIYGRSQNDAAKGNAQHDHYNDLHLSSHSSAPSLEYEQLEAIE
ncbi:MAG: hypothetical protein ABJ320_19330 [Lentilitoribacter sp.]|uniref:hypothetical protein n=1 Tax=Tateyamaria sp. TaxID=1929288 RepID=UPI00327730BB